MTTLFLKLGGSLITDKAQPETVRTAVLARLAEEIAAARAANPGLRLLLGHGSGSFGHVAAQRHGTREGVAGSAGWAGFAEVSDAALRLNALVRAALLSAGVPAVSLSPSASARCRDGALRSMAGKPLLAALDAGLLPVVHGDVAFDTVRGGTIVSTEEVLEFLVPVLAPDWLLLAGETEGVYAADGTVAARITPRTLPALGDALRGSRGTDVTGGMLSKVVGMVALAARTPGLSIRIFSGLLPGQLARVLAAPALPVGTLLDAD